MGATDYLVRPISGDDLLQVIYKALQHKIGTSNSRFITVMGSKGGVGTSRMTQALAQTIATHEEKITLLDSGGSWGATGSSFGFEPLIALRDLVGIARTQEATLDDLRHTVTPYLSWIAAGGDPLLISTLVIDGFEILIDALLRRCPNLIIDLSQSATGIRALAFAKAHHIVLVTNATPIALRNTRLLIKEIQNMRGSDAPIHLIVNQHGALSKDEISIRDIATTLHIQPSAIVAHQPDLFSQIDTLEGNEFLQAMDKIVPSLQDLAHKITGRRGVANAMPQDRTLIQRFLQRG
jgi:pilus assembly protein CpaE